MQDCFVDYCLFVFTLMVAVLQVSMFLSIVLHSSKRNAFSLVEVWSSCQLQSVALHINPLVFSAQLSSSLTLFGCIGFACVFRYWSIF